MLVQARPAGTDKYSVDEQVQRAATIATSPDGFLALWHEFVRASNEHPVRDTGDDDGDSDPGDGVREPSNEERLKRSLFYGNRQEWGKAWQAWMPQAQRADGCNPTVQKKVLELTPQCLAPRPELTADQPGVEPLLVRQETFNQRCKRLPRGRRGGW